MKPEQHLELMRGMQRLLDDPIKMLQGKITRDDVIRRKNYHYIHATVLNNIKKP